MSSRSTTRASFGNATAPFEPRARPSSGVRRACPWMCYVLVTSRLVTFSACSGLLVQRSWLYSVFDLCFPRVRPVFFLALVDPMCKADRALRELLFWRYRLSERGVLRHCNRLRPSGGLSRERLAAAAHLYLQQQAAACMASRGCSPLKGKGVRTGGRLHPGPVGERLLKKRPHATSRGQCALRSWFWVLRVWWLAS